MIRFPDEIIWYEPETKYLSLEKKEGWRMLQVKNPIIRTRIIRNLRHPSIDKVRFHRGVLEYWFLGGNYLRQCVAISSNRLREQIKDYYQ